jgi:hypothetical protein
VGGREKRGMGRGDLAAHDVLERVEAQGAVRAAELPVLQHPQLCQISIKLWSNTGQTPAEYGSRDVILVARSSVCVRAGRLHGFSYSSEIACLFSWFNIKTRPDPKPRKRLDRSVYHIFKVGKEVDLHGLALNSASCATRVKQKVLQGLILRLSVAKRR